MQIILSPAESVVVTRTQMDVLSGILERAEAAENPIETESEAPK